MLSMLNNINIDSIEIYLEPSRISTMEFFHEKLLTNFAKKARS